MDAKVAISPKPHHALRRKLRGPKVRISTVFDHISIGVKNVAKSKKFYDEALKPLGFKCLSESAESLGYGADAPALWVGKSASPVPADRDSGLHFCFTARSRKSVDAFYKAALAAGGKDNGKPGLRADYGDNYYAAFVIDPDGYRLEAYCGAKD